MDNLVEFKFIDTEPPPFPTPQHKDSLPSTRSQSDRKPKVRERNANSTRDLARLLAHGEREVKELKQMLYRVTEQLQAEKHRADDAERKAREIATSLTTVNEARLLALQDANKANEELKLYRLQLNAAQKEIYRAQDILSAVDKQRLQAEKDAAKARTTIRKLNEERMVFRAREEGRRLGIQEGLERGRDMGFHEAHLSGYVQPRYSGRSQDILEDEGEGSYSEHDRSSRSSSTGTYASNSRFVNLNAEIQPPTPNPPEVSIPVPPVPVPAPVPPPGEASPVIQAPIPPPGEVSPVVQAEEIHPRVVHNTSSFRDSHVIPPDGWIPETGADAYIYLPPPHGLSRPVPTPDQSPLPSPSPPLPQIPESEEPLMIPANTLPRYTSQRQRRPSSPESNSTTISQFDMVNDPGVPSPMSVIPEVRSVDTSPNPQTIKHQPSWGANSSRRSQPTVTQPTPRSIAGTLPSTEQPVIQQGKYSRPRSVSSSTESSRSRQRHYPATSSSSSMTVPGISIEPASRPTSSTLRDQDAARPAAGGDWLSASDADRYTPMPDRSREPTLPGPTTTTPSLPVPSTASTNTMVLPDGQLPPGFMATGFTPGVTSEGLPALPEYNEDADQSPMPGGLYHDTNVLQTPHLNEAPVIPDPRLYDGTDSDDAVSSAISSNTDTLTTPPAARRAGLPRSNSNYTGTSRIGAAGVPLPPSTVAGTPRSRPDTGYGGIYSKNAGKTPKTNPKSLSQSSRGG